MLYRCQLRSRSKRLWPSTPCAYVGTNQLEIDPLCEQSVGRLNYATVASRVTRRTYRTDRTGMTIPQNKTSPLVQPRSNFIDATDPGPLTVEPAHRRVILRLMASMKRKSDLGNPGFSQSRREVRDVPPLPPPLSQPA